jgi:hypothetical protein
MATATAPQISTQPITERLSRLRGQIRRWVLVYGLGRWLWLMLGIAAVDMLLDRMFKMDFAQRLIVLVLILAVGATLLLLRIIKPLFKPLSDDALILQVEHRNPDLQQSVISGYQLARDSRLEAKGVSMDLAQATIKSGVERASKVDFATVLDATKGQLNWLLLGAAALAIGGIVLGVMQTDFMRTWFRRNLLLSNDQWPQATYLEIDGVENGVIFVPRGNDHRQIVRVTPESAVSNVAISIEIDAAGGRTIHLMKPTGRDDGREHAFTFHSVASDFRFRAKGGDDETDWVEVKLVEPPAITALQLQSILPGYTGLENLTLDGTGPHSVLVGSELDVMAESNKPLAKCQLRLGETLIDMVAEDSHRQKFSIRLPGSAVNSAGPAIDREPAVTRIAGVQGGKYEFRMTDETGLLNTREFSFTLKTREDRPPNIRANLLGISGLVVPRAIVPTAYTATDEYGVTSIDIQCQWASERESAGPTSAQISIAKFNARPPVAERQDVAVLRLEELKLTPETSLRFVLQASDNQPETPGVGNSREFLLRVVTEEELLADLLRREIEQRKAFQQTYDGQMELISQTRQLVAVPLGGATVEQMQTARQNDLISLYRAQRAIGTSVDAVAKRFVEFLVEVQNNRLDEETRKVDPNRTIESRFDQEIIRPLQQLDQEMITQAARNLDNCRRNLPDESLFNTSVNDTILIQENILDRMRQILAAMEDSENYQEVVNKLLEIKRAEERMKQQLNDKGQPEKIFDQGQKVDDKKGVFDEDK